MSIILNKFKSALTVAKEGNSKAAQLQLLTNSWELTQEQKDMLGITSYFILQWEGKYVKDNICDGIIYYPDNSYSRLLQPVEDIPYCVIYRSCSPANVFKNPQVRLSFRASPIGNFVLIQPVYKKPLAQLIMENN